MPPKATAKPAVTAAKKAKLPEPNAEGHVEIDTDAPRAGPLGDLPAQREADVIAAAAADHKPGDGPNFPDEREAPDA